MHPGVTRLAGARVMELRHQSRRAEAFGQALLSGEARGARGGVGSAAGCRSGSDDATGGVAEFDAAQGAGGQEAEGPCETGVVAAEFGEEVAVVEVEGFEVLLFRAR